MPGKRAQSTPAARPADLIPHDPAIPAVAIRLARLADELAAGASYKKVEYALRCFLSDFDTHIWAYDAARLYAERYDSRYGSGLNRASARLVRDLADFWHTEVANSG